jgi:predicted GNAT family N-acyltransferase
VRGYGELQLTALAAAAPFYERTGWRRLGAEVLEDGQPHVPMGRAV